MYWNGFLLVFPHFSKGTSGHRGLSAASSGAAENLRRSGAGGGWSAAAAALAAPEALPAAGPDLGRTVAAGGDRDGDGRDGAEIFGEVGWDLLV